MADFDVASGAEGDQGPEPIPDVEPEPELTRDEKLEADLASAMTLFIERQRELRRLGRYMQERAGDIDDVKVRAKDLIEEKLSSVNVDALDGLMTTIEKMLDEVLVDEALSDEERQEVLQGAIQAVAAELPEGALSSYLDSILRVTVSQPATPMLFSSLLITLVGELEALVGNVARGLYAYDDSVLQNSGRTYQLSEIEKFSSIEELRQDAAERAVESMLRESFTGWMSTLNKQFQVPTPARSTEYETLEVIQRRHVLVHNAGIASRQYLQNLSDFESKVTVKEKDRLTVDHDYFQRASDALFVVALSLVHGALVKQTKDIEVIRRTEGRLANACFHLLQEKRYETVVSIVKNLDLKRMINESSQHITRVNGWLALKLLGRFSECRREVVAFDTRSKSKDLRLAKLALLDEVSDANDLAQEMLTSGELLPEHWLTWPLLSRVRDFHEARGNSEGAPEGSGD